MTKQKGATRQAAASGGVAGVVQGVRLAKVQPDLVEQNLKSAWLDCTGTLAEKVARLVQHYRDATPQGELGDCADCGGDSDVREEVCPVCPYCGVAGVTPVGEVPPDSFPEPPSEPPNEPPSGADAASGAPSAPPAPAPPQKPAKTPPGPKNEESTKLVQVQGKGKGKSGPELVDLNAYTEADLDDRLRRLEEAKRAEVSVYWDIGALIEELYSKKLYLQRRDAAGKPRYETWGQFCVAELGMTSAVAFRIQDVARNFDRATAIKVGVRKLNVLLRIESPERRAKLLEEAERTTAEDLELRVQRVVEKQQQGKPADRGRLTPARAERNAKATVAAAKQSAEAKAENVAKNVVARDTISVALALGKTAVKLFVKGSRQNQPDAKRAKRLADEPVGWEETLNGVVTRYAVATDASGALLLIIKRERS